MKTVTVWQNIYQLLIFQHQDSTVQTCTDERGGRDDSDPLELRQRWSASSDISKCLSSAWEQTSAIGDFRFKLCRSDKMHLFQKSQGYFKTKQWTSFILNSQVFYTAYFVWALNLNSHSKGRHRMTVFEHKEQRRICRPTGEEEKECRRKEHTK